jgi:16S rRNA (cytidine1402-2'-O)-methyltransferase
MADVTEGSGLRVIPPGLHLVSTPIGAARDITLRALDVLAGATVLAAEDTRTLRHLMEIHGIALNGRQIVAYHEHNADAALPRLLQSMAAGSSVAYASEAGTPMVSDPGYGLVRAAISAGHPVIAVPGASAVLSALVVSGLPTDRFMFAGFPPTTKAARRTFLQGLQAVPATLILYESPKRVQHLLEDMTHVLGEGRQAVVCRELTKRFEEISRGTLADLVAVYADRTVKGEIVVLVDRPSDVVVDAQMLEQALEQALTRMTVKDAAAAVAEAFGIPRREVYQMALKRTKG